MVISLRPGRSWTGTSCCTSSSSIQYERNDVNFHRNTFRVRGDAVEIFPAYADDTAVRVEFFGDEIDRICEINPVTGDAQLRAEHMAIYPASHYVGPKEKMDEAIADIEREMEERVAYFKAKGKLLEAQRIEQRTSYDMEMLQEMGFCTGIENYSRVICRPGAGHAPYTLLDYFPKDFLLFIDESHVTLPQVRGMYDGDRARKETLVDYGFRLPSAFDNRPLNFDEFTSSSTRWSMSAPPRGSTSGEARARSWSRSSAPRACWTPRSRQAHRGPDRRPDRRDQRAAPSAGAGAGHHPDQKDGGGPDRIPRGHGIRVRYMHHDIDTIERMEIIRDLRLGEFDVLVGINLLREGLDMPEVSWWPFWTRTRRAFCAARPRLIQTIGRAARNADGQVIMYADQVTPSMEQAITETERRRAIQEEPTTRNTASRPRPFGKMWRRFWRFPPTRGWQKEKTALYRGGTAGADR